MSWLIPFLLLIPQVSHASLVPDPSQCGSMEYWDYARWMCMPKPMTGMPMSMWMVHGNAFGTGINAEGPRGGRAFASANMLMADYGQSVADHHYLNVELMATAEKWTMPAAGYPELAQAGDYHADNEPFVDRQHPHSSPIMGLTFSDTIDLESGGDYLKLFIAPRGASTDGPVAFMHRPTGMANPVAPLGHHVGQDVGHVSSGVYGIEYGFSAVRLEFSTFNGEEPSPTKVDLPTATPNSYAGRLTIGFNPSWFMMASTAYVEHPDPNTPDLDHYSRYSLSSYNTINLGNRWTVYNSLIYGLNRNPGGVLTEPTSLNSFAEEFLFDSDTAKIWGRSEVLQRTPGDLEIAGDLDPSTARWVSAWTIGYTRTLVRWTNAELNIGASITKTFLPVEFQPPYGGNPLSENVFLQLQGMKMATVSSAPR